MRVALTHNIRTIGGEEQAEFDMPETIRALCAAVASAGHEAIPIEVTRPTECWLRDLKDSRPDVILNTAEGQHGAARAALFPAVFAAAGIRFTGSDARVQALTQDKQMTRLCVAQAGVPVAPGVLIRPGDALGSIPAGRVIVKPNFEGSSKGITESSVVDEPGRLAAAVAQALFAFPDGVLVEEFIPGTDVAATFFEGFEPSILTPCSYVVDPQWGNRHRLYDYRLKNIAPDEAVQVACPARIPQELIETVRVHAGLAVRALGLRGVARLDFRVRDDGLIFFVEANATPSLEPGSSIFVALQARGIDFPTAINRLIEVAS